MYRTKIDICTLCIGFAMKLDESNYCSLLPDKHSYPCSCNDESWYQEKINQFDDFIAEQTEEIQEVINEKNLSPDEMIELIYEISQRKKIISGTDTEA